MQHAGLILVVGRIEPDLVGQVLNDNDWLWGGSLDQIAQTITHGVRAGDDAGTTSRRNFRRGAESSRFFQ
jgi:hypothetical protein